jgi:dienelactone hydrolase/uncharacterized protein (DUF952 family)
MSSAPIFHLMPRAAWLKLQTQQPYSPASLRSEGFIHASTAAQLPDTAARYYRGIDVVAFQIRTANLDIRYEQAATPGNVSPAAGSFPHIYQPIPESNIERTIAVVEGAQGKFRALFGVDVERDSQVFGRCTATTVTFDGVSRRVFVGGAGPAVVVMHEIPGLHPGVFAFAERLISAGFSVYLPSMFGVDGQPPSPAYIAKSLAQGCVSREFAVWATDKQSPIVDWLRQLAAVAHHERGGPGVGAIGMCFTGNFALGMMVEPSVIAPALSQPSLPFSVTGAQRRAVGVDSATLQAVCARAKRDDLQLIGMRFTGDAMVPGARFSSLKDALGERFIAIEIDSSRSNVHDIPRTAHSVLTHHYVDSPGHPTRAALDRLIAFFQARLTK